MGRGLAMLDCGHEIPYERPEVLDAMLMAFIAAMPRVA